MRLPSLAFIALFSLFKLTELIWSIYLYKENRLPANLLTATPICQSEQQFALGHTIALSSADIYDLELIPKISDKLAYNILNEKERIISAEHNKNSKKKLSPLELAHGVGKKTASRLSFYLSLK